MKKLLMIGAVLIMGTLGYGAQRADLDVTGNDANATGAADTTLTLRTRGNVVDATNNAVLVITPLNSTGASGDKLMFHFGSVTPGSTTTLKGKFKAEVLKQDMTSGDVKYGDLTDKIKVGLVTKTGTTDPVITDAEPKIAQRQVNERGTETKVGEISYELTSASGVKNGGKTYEGEILSTFTALDNEDSKGAFFTDTGVMVVVNVEDVAQIQ